MSVEGRAIAQQRATHIVRTTAEPSRQSRILQRTSRIAIKPSLNALISVYGMLITVGPKGVAKARWLQSIVSASDYLAAPLQAVKGSAVEVLALPRSPVRIEKVVGPDADRRDAAIVFFHGGGMVAGGFNTHRRLLSRLSMAAETPVYSVEYRLMIANEYADSVADGLGAYQALLENGTDPAKTVLGGDSGGAAVALGVAIAIRDAGLPMPAGMVILSPWIDFDPTVKLADPRARQDAAIPIVGAWPMSGGMLMAKHVLADSVEAARALSPIRSNLAGLPPFVIHAADTEILSVDAQMLVEHLVDAGVAAKLKLWSGQIHVFQLAADLVPEGRQSLAELGEFVARVTGHHTSRKTQEMRKSS